MKEKNTGVLRLVLRVLQGMLIGVGAVLPGISGGVLCVVFGIYKPIMELLSSPIKKWKTHVPRLLPVIVGAVLGFLGVAKVLAFFLERYPDQSVCLFVGLIAGMLPSLFREAGEQGRTRGSWISLVAAFAVVLALLILATLVRAVLGPRFTDRIVAVNVISTLVIAELVLLSVWLREDFLVDVALVFALLSFLAVVVVSRLVAARRRKRPEREKTGGNAHDR